MTRAKKSSPNQDGSRWLTRKRAAAFWWTPEAVRYALESPSSRRVGGRSAVALSAPPAPTRCSWKPAPTTLFHSAARLPFALVGSTADDCLGTRRRTAAGRVVPAHSWGHDMAATGRGPAAGSHRSGHGLESR